MTDARLIFVSSNQRRKTLSEEYDLDAGQIRAGDYLFKFDDTAKTDRDVFEDIERTHRPFIKVIFKNKNSFIIKVLPDKGLFDSLRGTFPANTVAKNFLEKVTEYFFRNQKQKWDLGNRLIDFNKAPLVMGILNVTPDSFSDGGQFFDKNKAIDHALIMIDQGADIIDVGGESTRPGAQKISSEDELKRVIPVIEGIRKHYNGLISIDSYKSVVADTAVQSGADIINDISGLSYNQEMLEIIEKYRCPYILMHIQGTPQTMQSDPSYEDVQNEVYNFLLKKGEVVSPYNDGRIIIDPGFGFGKNIHHNLLLLRDLVDFSFIGKPVLVGVSRKSFIGKILDKDIDNRLIGTLVSELYASLKNADILRVHDIAETIQAKKMLNQILDA